MSPAVVASWITEQRGDGPVQLQLLVLWRGTPGWFLAPGAFISGDGSSINGRVEVSHQVISYGDVQLALDYDSSRRIAIVHGQTVNIADDNVVFVDDVDSANGPRVTRTMKMPRAMPGSAGQIGVMLGKSPDIMSFLRCDSRPLDARGQAFAERLCLENIGRQR